jgi:hypothetical protein
VLIPPLRLIIRVAKYGKHAGRIDRARAVAPARAHIRAECGNLLVIETDALSRYYSSSGGEQ